MELGQQFRRQQYQFLYGPCGPTFPVSQPMYIHSMPKIRYVAILISLLFLSACSTPIHKDFLQNFRNSKKTDGSRPKVVVSLAYNEKEKYLLVGHESGSIEIWDTKKERSVREIKAHNSRANLLFFSADGNTFFSNSYFEKSTKLWEVQSGELICIIPDTRGPVSATSEKRFYIIANSEELRIFDYKNKALLPEKFKFSHDVVTAIAYDISNDQVAIGTASGTIQLLRFSIIDGKPSLEKISNTSPYQMGNWVIGLKFSDKGRNLYSVAKLGPVYEWTSQPLKINRSLPTTLNSIASTSILPNEGLLALSGRDKGVYPSMGTGFVEILSLSATTNSTFKTSTDYPGPIEFLSPLSSVISAESYSVEVYGLPQAK